MKNLIVLSTFFAGLLFTNNTYAKIWRVNNTVAVVADFTTIQAAHDAATAGDTIHIEQSLTNYASVTCTKPLVYIGQGYFLSGAGGNAGVQANTNTPEVGTFTFNAGSSNSVVTGIYLQFISVHVANITIKRNHIFNTVTLYAGANNVTVNGNYFDGGITDSGGGETGLSITNNIFNSASFAGGAASSGTFENNTLYQSVISMYNFQVDNNIWDGGTFTPHNSVYANNISNSTQVGNANNNQQNVSMTSGFFAGGASTDGQYKLAVGSVGIGAGYLGVDCGAYGNASPYVMSGIPDVPTIYSLSVPAFGTNTINVTISTRSNN